MPRKPTDTRDRIQAAAMELFVAQGIQQTSLQQIADRLGITKPALYYHFKSREDLVRSLVQPLIDEFEALLDYWESTRRPTPRELLESYFDRYHRHRQVNLLVVRDLSALAHLDLGARVLAWRRRMIALLVGAAPTLTQQAQAVVALGGLADCTVMFADVPPEQLRSVAVDAALAALPAAQTVPTEH